MKPLQDSLALVVNMHPRSAAVSNLAEDVSELVRRYHQKERECEALRAGVKNADHLLGLLYTELGCEPTEALSRIRELNSKSSPAYCHGNCWNCAACTPGQT